MALLTKEDLDWNDNNLNCILSANNNLRVQAQIQILNRCKNDQYYILILLQYASIRVENETLFHLSLIVIKHIIKTCPTFLYQNLIPFNEYLLGLFTKIKEIPNSRNQLYFANICQVSMFSIIKKKKSTGQNYADDLNFYAKLYIQFMSEVNTLPLAFYTKNIITECPNLNKNAIFNVISRIIKDYYPISHDFNLLNECIKYFSTVTSQECEFSEDCENIFNYILELAQNSTSLEEDKFNSFWSYINDINISRSNPFINIVLQIMPRIQKYDSRINLLNFIENHISQISPSIVPNLIDYFFQTISLQADVDSESFYFLSSLSIFDFKTFDYSYNIALKILENKTPQSYAIYLFTINILIKSYAGQAEPYIPEIVTICMEMCKPPIITNLSIFEYILQFFVSLMSNWEFRSVNKINEIPFFLLDLSLNVPILVIKNGILHSLALTPANIDRQAFFDKILELFYKQASVIDLSTATHLFMILSTYLPVGRLFPEEKYRPIHELIQKYIIMLDYKKNPICYILSIFIFKLYIRGQEQYSILLNQIFFNFCTAFSYINDFDILSIVCNELKIFIKLFKKVALKLFRDINYHSQLYQFLFLKGQVNYSNPYMQVLALVCKHDKEAFPERKDFFLSIMKNITAPGDNSNQEAFGLARKFIYFTLNSVFLDRIAKKMKTICFISIQKMDIEKLECWISIYESLIKPSHISNRNKKILEQQESDPKLKEMDFDYQAKVKMFINDLIIIAQNMASISSNNKSYFVKLYFSLARIAICLSPYDCQIVHCLYELFYQYIIQSENILNISEVIAQFFLIGASMMDSKIIQEKEIEMILALYDKILVDGNLQLLFVDVYISMSHLILIQPVQLSKYVELLLQHWGAVNDEKCISVLCTLFLMFFVKIPNIKELKFDIFDMAIKISDRFKPTEENSNYYIQASIQFLTTYQNIPIPVFEHFLHSFIIYLSYQKFSFYLFRVNPENHRNLIEFVKQIITKLPNWQNIFIDCFPGSPQSLKNTLDLLGIPYNQNPDQSS